MYESQNLAMGEFVISIRSTDVCTKFSKFALLKRSSKASMYWSLSKACLLSWFNSEYSVGRSSVLDDIRSLAKNSYINLCRRIPLLWCFPSRAWSSDPASILPAARARSSKRDPLNRLYMVAIKVPWVWKPSRTGSIFSKSPWFSFFTSTIRAYILADHQSVEWMVSTSPQQLVYIFALYHKLHLW